MNRPLSGDDKCIALGLAAYGLTLELIGMLSDKKILSDDEALAIFIGAIEGLCKFAEVHPHPAWRGAQNLLRRQAARFGGPEPGTKPN